MKIYVDLVFFLNFAFDFLLLTGTSYLLKRNVSWKRLLLGGLIGALSIFFLFIPLNSFFLFFLKVAVSILMCLATFSFKSWRFTGENLLYLYLSSILLGGCLYFLNTQFSYKNEGLIFFHNGLSINFVLLLIFGPFILYIYMKQLRKGKGKVDVYHTVDVYLKDGTVLKLNGYLDTGNQLKDPYHARPITLVYSKKIPVSYENSLLVPFETLEEKGLLPCIMVEKLVIDKNHTFSDCLIGISKTPFALDGVDVILPNAYKEALE